MSRDIEIELPDGSIRRLGNNPQPGGLAKVWKTFGDTPTSKLFARSEWDGIVSRYGKNILGNPGLPPVHDQNGVGQCNADATTAAMEAARMQQGLPYVQLSAADLYSQINGGADNGSLLEDGLHTASTVGVGTAATSGTVWKRGNWKGAAPAVERAKYRVIEALLCPTFGHAFSATAQGFKLITGIAWCNNYNPGEDGWLPSPGSQVGGHAIFGDQPTSRTPRGTTQYGIVHLQSWGEWGLQNTGIFVIPEQAYGDVIGGIWAVRAMVDEGGVVPQEE